MFRDNDLEVGITGLVSRYQDRVFRLLLGMVRNRGAAEELTQRVFVKAALRIEQLKKEGSFKSWVLSIARTTALDYLRSRKRAMLEEYDDEWQEQPTNSGGSLAKKVAAKEAVHKVLAKMPEEDRAALLLGDLEQLSMVEMAAVLGIKESAAKMRLKRARARFREIFEEETNG